jgi:hypothetical protein
LESKERLTLTKKIMKEYPEYFGTSEVKQETTPTNPGKNPGIPQQTDDTKPQIKLDTVEFSG